MKRSCTKEIAYVAAAALAGSAVLLWGTQGREAQTFDQRLESKVAAFDTRGRPLARVVLDLASEYKLPLGIEYVDRGAVRRRLDLRLTNKTVRDILGALVDQLPQYRLSISPGVVEIYSPQAREDKSNVLNVVIDDFAATETPRLTSYALYQALMDRLHQPCCLIGNVMESGDARPMALHLQRMRVYEILNALVAQDGQSLWVPTVPPEQLSALGAKPWEVYELGWPELVMGTLQRLFPPDK